MNELVTLLEAFPKDEILRLKFSNGDVYDYRGFEGVDESIYQDDSYVVGELLRPGKEGALVEFQVHEIIQIMSTKTNEIVFGKQTT